MLQACPLPEDIDDAAFVMQEIGSVWRRVFEVDANGALLPTGMREGMSHHQCNCLKERACHTVF